MYKYKQKGLWEVASTAGLYLVRQRHLVHVPRLLLFGYAPSTSKAQGNDINVEKPVLFDQFSDQNMLIGRSLSNKEGQAGDGRRSTH